ncbi:Protein of unknown function [Bacillus cereus]|nr:Protein of unknown function [Bacillus cereus]
MKRGIIDRFEGELAVIEVNNVTIDVPTPFHCKRR